MFKNLSSTKKINFELMNLWNKWMKKKNRLRIFESIAKFEAKAKMFLRKFSVMSKNSKNEFRMSKKKWFSYRSILTANLRDVILLYCIQTKKSKNSISEFRWIEWFHVWRKWQLKKKNFKKWKKKTIFIRFRWQISWIFDFSIFWNEKRRALVKRSIIAYSNRRRIICAKKKLLIEMLYCRETCLVWKFSKIKKIKSKISSTVKIRTVFHQIWQISNFQILRALNDVISMMIKKRLRNKILKSCYDSYRNFWFLVKKKRSKNIDLSTLFWKWIESSFVTRVTA